MRNYVSLALAIMISIASQAGAQDSDEIQIKTTKLTDSIYMLEGAGGNIGICAGEDGVFVIDDQVAGITDKILAAAKEISDQPVKFLLNTHWHSDHTGGNEEIGKTGTVIFAHENVRKLLTEEQFIEFFNKTVAPLSKVGLPVVTFTDAITFHFNDEEIEVYHVEPSHTNGDAMVRFKKANIVHTGDVLFAGSYPFIDIDHGGSVGGTIRAAQRLYENTDENTRFIPGHGNLASRADLKNYIDMLSDINDRVNELYNSGKSLEEAIAAKPTAAYDEQFGSFIGGDVLVGFIYKEKMR